MTFLDDDIGVEYEFDDHKTERYYRVASVSDRMIAGAIDLFIAAILFHLPVLKFVLFPAYIILRDSIPALDGQSIGKKIMKLRTIDEKTGQTLIGNYEKAFMRNITLMIPIFNIFDAIHLITTKSKRYGDEWANSTVVIKEE